MRIRGSAPRARLFRVASRGSRAATIGSRGTVDRGRRRILPLGRAPLHGLDIGELAYGVAALLSPVRLCGKRNAAFPSGSVRKKICVGALTFYHTQVSSVRARVGPIFAVHPNKHFTGLSAWFDIPLTRHGGCLSRGLAKVTLSAKILTKSEFKMTVRVSQAHKVQAVFAIIVVALAVSSATPVRAQAFAPVPPLAFTKQFAKANPLPQILNVESTGAAFTFNVTVSTNSGGSWLSASKSGNNCCTTPEVITVTVNDSTNLAAGTYTGQVVFSAAGVNSLTVPVALTIAATGSAFLDNVPGGLSFALQTGASTVPAQTFQIRNGGSGPLNWTLSTSTSDGGGWLSVTPGSGTAPSTVTAKIVVSGLPGGGSTAGTFIGQISIQASGSSETIPVSVTVGDNIFRQVNPLSFSMQFSKANPLPQYLNIVSTGQTAGSSITFDAAAVTGNGGNWLTISKSGNACCTTPEVITVSVSASTLAAGTYTGQITFIQSTSHDVAIIVPVTLTVAATNTTFFDDISGEMSFSLQTAATSVPSQTLQIRNGGPGTLTWKASKSTADGGNWLTVTPVQGTAPSTVTVRINPAALPAGGQIPGNFIGQISFVSASGGVTVPVEVTVGDNVFRQVNPISFTMPFGGANPLPQILSAVSTGESSGSSITFDAAAVTGNGGSWLTISKLGNACCTTPEVITVSVTANTLAAGTYTGEITFTQSTSHDMAITVPVTLTVEATGSTFFDNVPGQLSFSLLTGASSVPAQTLQIRDAGSGTLTWMGSKSTADGGNWLTVTPLSGTAPSTVTVGIVPSRLPGGGQLMGTFIGQVSFLSATGTVTVPIKVTVGDNVFRQVNPISFTMPAGGANPLPQFLSIVSSAESNGSSITFDAAAATGNGGNWLTISKLGNACCTTPEVITVSVTANTLAAGTYTGEITFTQSTSHDMAITVPVTLTVEATGSTFFDNVPGQLSFSLLTGASSVPAQTLQIRDAGSGTLTWMGSKSTADGGNWLTVTPLSGTAPSTVTVGIVPSRLPGGGQLMGTFIGQVSFLSATGTVTVPIKVTVGDNVFRQVNPISFTMPAGGANPLPQFLSIVSSAESNGSSITFDAAAATGNGGNWLTISKSGNACCTTPEVITVSVTANTLAAGTYTGEITFTQSTSHDMAITVPVTLTVEATGSTFFDNVPGQLSFSFTPSTNNPPPQAVLIQNGGPGTLNWTATRNTADGGNWLTVSPTSGTAPSTISVGVVTANLPGGGLIAGTYIGQVSLQAAAGNVTVPVTVYVDDPVFVQLIPVTFSTTVGVNPPSQMVTVSSTSPSITFDASATNGKGGTWLSISPQGNACCTTPRVITVSVNVASLGVGTYVGQMTFTQSTSHDKATTVPVILTIGSPLGPNSTKQAEDKP